jgi:hypothetical protein
MLPHPSGCESFEQYSFTRGSPKGRGLGRQPPSPLAWLRSAVAREIGRNLLKTRLFEALNPAGF